MTHHPRISSIYRHANAPAPTGAEAEARNREAYARAWHQHGLACIDPGRLTDEWVRQVIINTANELYGRRK